MPAKATSGRSSLSPNQTTSFFFVSGFGFGAYSAKLLNGTTHRFSGLSHPRQCGDDVLRKPSHIGAESASPRDRTTAEGAPNDASCRRTRWRREPAEAARSSESSRLAGTGGGQPQPRSRQHREAGKPI